MALPIPMLVARVETKSRVESRVHPSGLHPKGAYGVLLGGPYYLARYFIAKISSASRFA